MFKYHNIDSTMKVYGSTVLVEIFILASVGAFIFSIDSSQTWGWPKPGDVTKVQTIKRTAGFFSVTYNSTLRMSKTINCVKFWDKSKTGATVWMSKEPPCTESVVTITSAWGRGFHFVMEVFHDK